MADVKCCRSMNFDVEAEQKQAIVASIRHYRAVLRQAYSALAMAHMAGSEIKVTQDNVTVKPKGPNAETLLALSLGCDGKALGYQLRHWVLAEAAPTWYSHTWDSLRRDMEVAWKSKDPKHPTASRGFLCVNGARDIASFNRRGIGIPAVRISKIDGHEITLAWDHGIGPVAFRLGKLDGGRYRVWRNVRDKADGWGLGTVYLNERDGKLRITMAYHMPLTEANVDQARNLNVQVGGQPEALIAVECEGRSFAGDRISAVEAIAHCARMEAVHAKIKAQRQSTGNPRKKWGSAKVWRSVIERSNRATARRENGCKHWNHAWTRRIVEHAIRTGAGSLVVTGIPTDSKLGVFSWPWAQFRAFLEYKASAIGATVQYA